MLTVPKYGGVLVGPGQLRQVFNDTDSKVLWLIVGAPEETEFLSGEKKQTGYVTNLSGRSAAIAKAIGWCGVAAKRLMGKFPNPRHGERLLSGDGAAHCTIGAFCLPRSVSVV
jgi:hypothetical protein